MKQVTRAIGPLYKGISSFATICLLSSGAFATESATSHNHTNLEVIESELQSAQSAQRSQKNRIWPELNLVGGYKEENFKIDPKKGAVAYLSFDWNLFDGGRSWADYQEARIGIEFQKVQTERKKRELYLYQLKLQSQLQKLNELAELEAIEVVAYAEQLTAAKKRVGSGLSSESDILELEIRQQSTQEHILELEQEKKQVQSQIQAMGEVLKRESLGSLPTDWQSLEFSKTLSQKEYDYELSQVKAREVGLYSAVLPKIDLSAQYGVIDPQDYTQSDKQETAVSLLVTIPLFSGGKNYTEMRSRQYENFAKDHRLRMQLKMKQSDFEIKKSRRVELQRLYDVHQVLAQKTEKLKKLVQLEFRRGVKDSRDWMEVTDQWVEVRKRLLSLELERKLVEEEILLY